MPEEDAGQNRQKMFLFTVGCLVLLVVFGCGPLAAFWFWWH